MKSELTTSTGVRLIRVAPGSFIMGSPHDEAGRQYYEGQREVTLPHEFYLGATPVTQRQFDLVMPGFPRQMANHPTVADDPTVGDVPVDSIWSKGPIEFCAKLTQIDRDAGILSHDWEYRLPTETEWEYACRAGTSGPIYGPLDSIAWHFGNADHRPHRVGEKAPNAWGFHDMLGNVWEMCQDWLWPNHQLRAARGGSYFNTGKRCRAAARTFYSAGRAAAFDWPPLASGLCNSVLQPRSTQPRLTNLRFGTRLSPRITRWQNEFWPMIPISLKESMTFHLHCTAASTKTSPRYWNGCSTTGPTSSYPSRTTVRRR